MTEYNNENQGALYQNDRKTKPTQPVLTGSMNVDGVDYHANAWYREEQATGKVYMSISLQEKLGKGANYDDAHRMEARMYKVDNPRSEKAPVMEGTIFRTDDGDEDLEIVAWLRTAKTTKRNFFSIKVNEDQGGTKDKSVDIDPFFGFGGDVVEVKEEELLASEDQGEDTDLDLAFEDIDNDIPF